MIKLTKLFFALSLLIFVNACSNDDDNAVEATLLGTWAAQSFNVDIQSLIDDGSSQISSSIVATGSNFSYNLNFTSETNYTTSGGYDMETSGNVDGNPIQASTTTYTNVMGTGTYISDETTITLGGSFFTFEFEGMPVESLGQQQTVDYEINSNDELVITQNETSTQVAGGTTVTTTIVSSSTWKKQ